VAEPFLNATQVDVGASWKLTHLPVEN